MSAIGDLFREARVRNGLSWAQAARAAGYVNVAKPVRRLIEIEGGRDLFPESNFRKRFIPVLGLSPEDVDLALSEDYAELARPTPPRVCVRLMSTVYRELPLPARCTPARAEDIAAKYAARTSLRVFLKLSGILGIYIEPDGTRKKSNSLPASSLFNLQGLPPQGAMGQSRAICQGLEGAP